MAQRKRIGILGGTFNPIHMGHLVLAEEAAQLLHLDKVIFVPVNLPSHKRTGNLVKPQQRYRMVVLATKSNPRLFVSDIELSRGGRSYSIETVKAFKAIFRQAKLYFIVGSDFLKEFVAWKDIGNLSKICKFIIAQRPGFLLKKLPKGMWAIRISAMEISSTDIRRRLKNKQSIRYLVPEAVRKYILKKKLYCGRIMKI